MNKINWGVLSTAKIGLNKVIPALQRSRFGTVTALASRDEARGREAAQKLGIAKVYASYEALLADPEIHAVYIPLPNHMHVPWAMKAMHAGKHVLCEKPIGLTSNEAQQLLEASRSYPKLKVMEAFMYRHHPQWQKTIQLIAAGAIGELRSVHSVFTYWNVDPSNIRNQGEIGGGGMMDIGCYCVSLSRFIFQAEPQRVLGVAQFDSVFKTDRMTSGVLEFASGTATFTCSTQLSPYQRVNVFGTDGRVEIEIPFNAPPDRSCRLWHQRGAEITEHVFDPCDQYTIQGDLFARAILDDTAVPTPLDDAVANMRVIEGVLSSSRSGTWV